MKQSAPIATVRELIAQRNGLEALKMLGTFVLYDRPTDELHHSLKLLVFSDAGRHCQRGQLAYLADLLMDDMTE